jgi:hypothetical protein
VASVKCRERASKPARNDLCSDALASNSPGHLHSPLALMLRVAANSLALPGRCNLVIALLFVVAGQIGSSSSADYLRNGNSSTMGTCVAFLCCVSSWDRSRRVQQTPRVPHTKACSGAENCTQSTVQLHRCTILGSTTQPHGHLHHTSCHVWTHSTTQLPSTLPSPVRPRTTVTSTVSTRSEGCAC